MSEEERKQRARENAKRYYQKNKEKVLKRQKEYARKRYREDEDFRNKVKEKNKNYVINNPEKAREIKRKSQHKYITKKRLNGELPLTQKMLINDLQKENQELKDRIDNATERLEALIVFWKKFNPIDNKIQVEQFKGVIETLKEE